jgi:hypothetical protein
MEFPPSPLQTKVPLLCLGLPRLGGCGKTLINSGRFYFEVAEVGFGYCSDVFLRLDVLAGRNLGFALIEKPVGFCFVLSPGRFVPANACGIVVENVPYPANKLDAAGAVDSFVLHVAILPPEVSLDIHP